MELFKCQAVLLFLAVAGYGILADSEPDNGMYSIFTIKLHSGKNYS